MGACGSSEAGGSSRTTTPHAHPPPHAAAVVRARTEVDDQPTKPQKKFCGTPGYDMDQRVAGSAIFFADFDQTFAKSHTFKTSLNMGEDGLQSCDMEVLQEWFGGVERLDALRIFLEKLVEVGVSTVIVTYGMPKLVKILLDRCGFLDSKYGIRGIFGCVRPGILYNKAQALIAIYEAMTDGKAFSDHRHEVLFADDSRSNIEAIERECDLPDEQNMLIDKNTAMTQEHMDIILEFFQGVAAKAGPSGAIGSSISGGTAGKDSASQQEDPGIPMLNQDQQETRTSPSSRSSSEKKVRNLTLI